MEPPLSLTERFVSVTLNLAGDTLEEAVDGYCVCLVSVFCLLCLCFGSHLLPIGQCAWFCFCSDRLFVLNIGVCTAIIRVRFRNV